jgi:hypothetical protein
VSYARDRGRRVDFVALSGTSGLPGPGTYYHTSAAGNQLAATVNGATWGLGATGLASRSVRLPPLRPATASRVGPGSHTAPHWLNLLQVHFRDMI